MSKNAQRRIPALFGVLLFAAYAVMPLLHLYAFIHPEHAPSCSTCVDGISFTEQGARHAGGHDPSSCGMCQILHNSTAIHFAAPCTVASHITAGVHWALPDDLHLADGPDVHIIGPRGPPC